MGQKGQTQIPFPASLSSSFQTVCTEHLLRVCVSSAIDNTMASRQTLVLRLWGLK